MRTVTGEAAAARDVAVGRLPCMARSAPEHHAAVASHRSWARVPPTRCLFTRRHGFKKALDGRIDTYLRDNHLRKRDMPAMYFKSLVALVWWLAGYLLLVLGHFPPRINLVLCIVWAMAIASVAFNIVHDANHGGYSDHPRINRLISLSAEILGISGFRWRTKHNVWHHTYTNIAGHDDDIETFGLMRLTSRAPWTPLHKFQAWYFPLVYSLIWFDFILRDFMMVVAGRSDANHVYPKMSTADRVTFWTGKLSFLSIMFAVPLLAFPWWQVVIGFLIVMLTVGVVVGVVFQLAHINGAAAFPEAMSNPTRIDTDWAIHQVETTSDFAPRNGLLSLYIGGLNYQIEHHLLPQICHMNYPRLAPIVRATCEEFGIRYNCYTTWRGAFAAHWRQLRLLGRVAEPDRSQSEQR